MTVESRESLADSLPVGFLRRAKSRQFITATDAPKTTANHQSGVFPGTTNNEAMSPKTSEIFSSVNFCHVFFSCMSGVKLFAIMISLF